MENLHVLKGSYRFIKSNSVMQVFPTRDFMMGHSSLSGYLLVPSKLIIYIYTLYMPNLSSMGVLDAPVLMYRFVIADSARLHKD